ncbi:MAG TPA: ammonium transporter [Actinomycetota bacterium]|nr:ammonium transporter [Actinomycetota bacterium]
MDSGDTAWILVSAALVMFMTPGLAFFYGGLVRSKNVLATIMHAFVALGVVTITWTVVGYTLAFGPDIAGIVGGLDFFGFKDVTGEPSDYAPTVPHIAFAIFQMMFAIITPALIAGAFAERMRFSAYVAFIAAWSILVYAPVAHWVWGGGFLGADGIGALDFAGGTVVHINAGAAALVAALMVGRRRGWPSDAGGMLPHNIPFVVLGASMLWFGWFGFNGGSALASNGDAAVAFSVTHIATAAAIFGWILPEWRQHGKPTAVGAATGAVAGLVAVTPAAGFIRPWSAIILGFVSGAVCYYAVRLKWRWRYDDSLDVVGVHFVGGIVGALLTGVFATEDGLVYGGGVAQLGRQAAGVVITIVWAVVATFVILKVIDIAVGLRVDEDAETTGLDLSQHGEGAYVA